LLALAHAVQTQPLAAAADHAFDVIAYGAVGDGAADDTPAISVAEE
jgi:polygalacturonase